jgi:hypothetical protein
VAAGAVVALLEEAVAAGAAGVDVTDAVGAGPRVGLVVPGRGTPARVAAAFTVAAEASTGASRHPAADVSCSGADGAAVVLDVVVGAWDRSAVFGVIGPAGAAPVGTFGAVDEMVDDGVAGDDVVAVGSDAAAAAGWVGSGDTFSLVTGVVPARTAGWDGTVGAVDAAGGGDGDGDGDGVEGSGPGPLEGAGAPEGVPVGAAGRFVDPVAPLSTAPIACTPSGAAPVA